MFLEVCLKHFAGWLRRGIVLAKSYMYCYHVEFLALVTLLLLLSTGYGWNVGYGMHCYGIAAFYFVKQ